MNLIDITGNNFFLKKIYPNGLHGDVLIGQINLDLGGRFGLNIHTKTRPFQEVAKWGKWGESYDVLVLKFLGGGLKNISAAEWINATYGSLKIIKNNELIQITHECIGSKIELIFSTLIFQSCSTYIDGGDEPAL